VRSVYHDDAIDDHGGAFCGTADAYVESVVDRLLNFVSSMHTLHNVLINLNGSIEKGTFSRTALRAARIGVASSPTGRCLSVAQVGRPVGRLSCRLEGEIS
jgi:hypothetical protein